MAVHSMSGRSPNAPVHTAMTAKVGAAAKASQPAAPEAASPLPVPVSTS